MNDFTYGVLTPGLAYVASVLGCLLGLQCTIKARSGGSRAGWLCLAALSIGGTGIWTMHFIAMLGFTISRTTITYNIILTLLSAALAVVVVGIGLFFVTYVGTGPIPLIISGTITGMGVAVMHYMGMESMETGASFSYDNVVVAISVLIAIVAAIAALWAAMRLRKAIVTVGAALVMGIAVSAMHYTGMAAMRMTRDNTSLVTTGAGAGTLLLPLIVGTSLITIVLLVLIGISPTEREYREDADFKRWIDRQTARR
jgi:NO-binding membrane sensor protein with MHYT domain